MNVADTHERTPLHYAIDYERNKNVQVLLNAGASANWDDDFGCTPLMTAADTSNVDCIDLLIKSGANVNLLSTMGKTALAFAVSQENYSSACTRGDQLNSSTP